ncbi:Essential protein Yae1 [Cladophialophora carrionii]|uniref:Essential protein Yae1 n=1 Tax=Cladophialophora carrionii TaxID=86049 RepID=A0A1C1CNC4_9EURO|nr:Essential protein Yae1 [Cladophialophora carrionii]
MATDPFDDLLDLENDYYQEGYNAGVSDSTYAGMIEGKVFGVEKGYEKALDLGKLHGRALLWQGRSQAAQPEEPLRSPISAPSDLSRLGGIVRALPQLSVSSRVQRHVESLHATSEASSIAKDNSDEAVTEFDDRIAKAKAKAKVVANTAGEALNPTSTSNAGIEDATGLQARH